jgi:hypothetical protein
MGYCAIVHSLHPHYRQTIITYIESVNTMTSVIPELEAALAELRKQGLTIRLHSGQNNTWHISDGGLYSGYVASGDELVELRRANKLSICGIKDLG